MKNLIPTILLLDIGRITFVNFRTFQIYSRRKFRNLTWIVSASFKKKKKWPTFSQERLRTTSTAITKSRRNNERDTSRDRKCRTSPTRLRSPRSYHSSLSIHTVVTPLPSLLSRRSFTNWTIVFLNTSQPLYPRIGHRSTNSVALVTSPPLLPPSFFVLLHAYLERNQPHRGRL